MSLGRPTGLAIRSVDDQNFLSIPNRRKIRAWNAWFAEAIPMKPIYAMPSQGVRFPAIANLDEATRRGSIRWAVALAGSVANYSRNDQAGTKRDAAGVARDS
jgi:hypothetical protein